MSEARTSGGRRSWLTHVASWLLGALTLTVALAAMAGCSTIERSLELGSGHAKTDQRIDKLEAKVRELDKRTAAKPGNAAATPGSND
jgi:hypothetical protein